jgi:SPFH domain/Band 7 family protein
VLVLALMVLGLAVAAWRWSFVAARPDEWLLRVRRGKLADAGVGIFVFRLPGDDVVRFSSTLQRVTFSVEALTADRLPLTVEGFLLWTVSPHDGMPLRAYAMLGLANLDRPPRELRSERHLLAAPQHHALQALVSAEALAACSTLTLEEAISRPEALAEELRKRLRRFGESVGLEVADLELGRVRPADPDVLRELGAPREEALRRIAELERLDASEAIAQRDREARRRASLAAEAVERELQVERFAREEAAFAQRASQLKREATTKREVALELLEVELRKPQALLDHELARLRARKAAQALDKLREARWVSVSGASPLESILGLLAGKN